MFSCKRMSELVSESFDRKLTLSEKLNLKFHMFMCRFCADHKHDLETVRTMIKQRLDATDEPGDEKLSPEARERIQQLLNSID